MIRRALAAGLPGALLLGLYALLRPAFWRLLRLPEEAYLEPVVSLQALRQPRIALLGLALVALPLARLRASAWARIEGGGSLRLLVGGLAALLAWSFAGLDANLYTGRLYAVDRILLALLAAGVFLHPVCIGPCAMVAALLAGQLEHPLGGYSWTDKLPVFQLLLVACAFTSLAAVRRVDARWLVALALTAHAADYLEPGRGKLAIGWLGQERMAFVWLGAHLNGWLPGLSEPAVLAVASWLDRLNAPLLWATLAIEVAPLLLLAGRRYAIGALGAATLLHAGIFASSGIFFWKWMALNLGWIAFLLGPERSRAAAVFGPRRPFLWLSLPLLLFGSGLFAPVRLAWINTPLVHAYELEVVGESGAVYPVGRGLLSPYDLTLAQNRFAYLVAEPHLAMTWGGTRDLEAAAALRAARSPEEVLAADRRFGRPHRDEARSRRFERFVARSFAELNRRGAKPRFPLGAPAHVFSGAGQGAYAVQEPVALARVRFVSTWFGAGSLVRLRDRVVREIPIPGRLSGP